MVSLDIYRPAAQEQLKSLGEQNNILTSSKPTYQLEQQYCLDQIILFFSNSETCLISSSIFSGFCLSSSGFFTIFFW